MGGGWYRRMMAYRYVKKNGYRPMIPRKVYLVVDSLYQVYTTSLVSNIKYFAVIGPDVKLVSQKTHMWWLLQV